MDLDEIKQVMDLLKESDVTEILIERDGIKLKIKREGFVPAPETGPAVKPDAPAQEIKEKPEEVHLLATVTSPIVGIFHRSPSPESPPFVEVGTEVKKGQVLCIVEAMKLMNEIESDVDGTITKIHVDNGHPVEYGEPLFLIEPSS